MSGLKKYFIFLTIILACTIALLFGVAASYKSRPVDVVLINDIVQNSKENFDNLNALDDKNIDADFLIFDNENNILYKTSDAVFSGIDSPYEAVQKNMLCMPINEGDIFYGTVVIVNPDSEDYNSLVKKLFILAILIVVIMLLSFGTFILYINSNIIKPFRKMKEFATHIAQGNLDEPAIMDKHNIFGIFTESFDVMREELKASRERELALKKREKELVASLSHDLKTPVTGIKLICELMAVKVKDEYALGKIENIEKKTEEINILLSDLLSSALDDLGEMNVNCTELTSDVLATLVEEHDMQKKTASGELPGCIIYADKNRLSQVIGNIISNSYKYADTKIDVTYKYNGKYLEMSIRDYGKGIDPEEIDLLTNKFYRGMKNTEGKEGSGLGLYIASELMKKMKGQLICSTYEDGFEVTLLILLA